MTIEEREAAFWNFIQSTAEEAREEKEADPDFDIDRYIGESVGGSEWLIYPVRTREAQAFLILGTGGDVEKADLFEAISRVIWDRVDYLDRGAA